MGEPEGIDARLTSPDEEVRHAAVQTLRGAGPAELARLVAALGDQSWRVRKAALEIVLDCPPSLSVPRLVAGMRDEGNAGLRNSSMEALWRYTMADEYLHLADPPTGRRQDPPPTDMNFSNRARLQSNAFSTLWLGVAIGLAWAAVFFLASLVVGLGGGTVLDFLKALYPGFEVGTFIGIILGVVWSFLYAFIFGLLVGLVYNALLRGGAEDIESYDIYG